MRGILRKCISLGRSYVYHGYGNRILRCYSTKTKPELTSIRYKIQRGPYSKLTDEHVNYFEGLLDRNRVITDPDECDGYNIDFANTVRGMYRRSK